MRQLRTAADWSLCVRGPHQEEGSIEVNVPLPQALTSPRREPVTIVSRSSRSPVGSTAHTVLSSGTASSAVGGAGSARFDEGAMAKVALPDDQMSPPSGPADDEVDLSQPTAAQRLADVTGTRTS